MNSLEIKTCEACGASIEFSPSDEVVFCKACGAEYEVVVHKEVGRPSPTQMVCYPLRILEGARIRLGSMLGTPGFDPRYDVNGDNIIDQKDLDLIRKELCVLAVYVTDLLGRPVEGARVDVDQVASAVSDESGMAGFPRMEKPTERYVLPMTPLVPDRTYTITASKAGYKTATRRYTFKEFDEVRVRLSRGR